MKQRTIAKEIILSGRSLHFNKLIKIILKPADVNKGIFITFKGKNIPLKIDYVCEELCIRRTTLKYDEVEVNTTEHLLSALGGMKIDNLEISIETENKDNIIEFPILDGAAYTYTRAIMQAGIIEQEEKKDFFTYPYPIIKQIENSYFAYIPTNELIITYTIYYPHFLIGYQTYSLNIDEESYYREIARARTFCTIEEVDLLRKKGLIKGGSLKQALVIGKETYLNDELYYNNEPVRHKILDFLGDLKLLGKEARGHFIISMGGHKTHVAFIKKIKKMEEDYVREKSNI